jgi:hypothetical protein
VGLGEGCEKIQECECEDTRHGEMLAVARGDRLKLGVRNGSNRGEGKWVYGRCGFGGAGKTGRGEETRVATLPIFSTRLLTLWGLRPNDDMKDLHDVTPYAADR